MENQEELIDSVQKEPKKKPASFYTNRTIAYIICMFGAGLVYTFLSGQPIFSVFLDAFLYALSSVVLAVPIEAIRKYLREKKSSKKEEAKEDDPLWFHIVESALSLMILLLVLSFLFLRK